VNVSRTRTERLVNLVICLLSTRRFLTASQIAATVPGYEHDAEDPKDHEAFQRKFERDKAELRELGVPLETGTSSILDAEPGYRIARRDYALPDINLAPDEAAAALAGLNVARLRILAFVVSAACAGLAGSMLAVYSSQVSPGSFTVTLSIALVTGAVIGGLGSLAGALWGSLVIVLVPTYVTNVATSHGLSSTVAANIPIVAYGVVLIAVMLLFPDGIQGGLRRLFGLPPPTAAVPLARLNSFRRRPPASEHQEEGTT